MLKSFTAEKMNSYRWNWVGVGFCSGHFGEIIQGQFSDLDDGSFRGLVTLCCRSIGMGSSASDIVATLRAMDQAYGNLTETDHLVKTVLQVETACDPTMLDHRVRLFDQRDGRVVEDFGRRMPPFFVFGFNLMPGVIFRTDETPPATYSADEVRRFDRMLCRLRMAIQSGDCRAIAEIATESPQDIETLDDITSRWCRMTWGRRPFESVAGHPPAPRPAGYNP